jgi:SAM-dependent methyltransferase
MEAFYREGYYEKFGAAEASPVRQAMLRLLLERIPRRPPGRLLDVGCGAGHLLAMARSAGWDVAGVDPSPSACAMARQAYGVEVQAAFLEAADLPEAAFDVVTVVNVLDQASNPVRLLEAVCRTLRPGGLVVVRVLNSDFYRMAWTFLRCLPTSMTQRLQPFVIFHPLCLNPRALRALLERAPFTRILVTSAPVSATEYSLPSGIVGRALVASLGALARTVLGAGAVLAGDRFRWAPSILAFAERDVR